MSQEELVEAYLQGGISRRTFVRRLVAAGVGLSAAVAYTHALRPELVKADHNPDHYEAPTVITTDASDFTANSAHLNADVDPNRFETKVWFEFGTSPSYGASTPKVTISGNGFRPVGAAVTGLDPGRVYHYRPLASNQQGQTVGADRTFAIPDADQPGISISPLDTDLDSVVMLGMLRVLITSDEAVALSLQATMKRKARRGSGKAKAKPVVIARGTSALDDGGDKAAELTLTRKGRRALKKLDRARLNVRVEATDLAGNKSVSQRRLRLS